MKPQSDDLFKLIKSLTPDEKRHFKLDALSNSSNSYMRLFELIDRQKVYNETLIIQQLKNNTVARNVNKWKTYISDIILKSLEIYHHTSDTETIIERELQRIRILQNRSLFNQAVNRLIKVRKLAISRKKPEYFAVIKKLEVLNLAASKRKK